MKLTHWIISIATLTLFSGHVLADAPLDKTLGLSHEQAAEVKKIQKDYRSQFRKVRGDYNRERRAFSRAENDHDTALMAEQQQKMDELRQQLVDIKAAEDAEIRALLTPEQDKAFDAYIEQRNSMVGSSRDAKLYAP